MDDEGQQIMFPGTKPIVPPDGPKWRPSNASEGMAFENEWCCRCAKQGDEDNGFCHIQGWTQAVSVDDPNYPREWQIRNDRPVCTAWQEVIDV